jgi:protocatechuate 3,4-dioxygenase alpha subunit
MMQIAHLQTPSQTVGPYFAYGLTPEQYGFDFKALVSNELIDPLHADAIQLCGRVFDGKGELIPDALVELWHCDSEVKAFGRCGTGTFPDSQFRFSALKPKPVGDHAPYFTLIISMRGQLIHSYTRIYFEDESEANELDPIMQLVPVNRRNTLIAKKTIHGYTFDIYMQGPNETVFFDI